MAIRIDIPGIGIVEVEGAASEETLQRLAAALEKSSAGLTKEQKDQAKATKDSTKAIKENTTGWVAAGDAFTQSLKNMALTATSVATKFFANYDTIAASPIKAGQSLLNTAIDLTANLAGGLASSIPVIGGFAKGVIDATAALAKMANDVFADQLQKNIDALQIYAKSGISFSGGMTQMQNAAQSAGLGIKDFAQGVSKAKTDLNFLGMAGGDAANYLADRMGVAGKIVGKSGQTLRQEMLAMGFSYDEQIEVMASYMANMKAAGKLEKMSKEEIALATRQYAADLKIVADFTGQDAKKQMERARAQQMLLAVQAKLSIDERERFGKASVILGRLGPDADKARTALAQYVTSGIITVQEYSMGPGRKMIESMAANISSGQEDVYRNSGRALQTLQRDLTNDTMMRQISTNKLLGAEGTAINNFDSLGKSAFAGGEITDDMIGKMQEQTENQGTATDQLTNAFQTVYESAQKLKTETEAFVNSKLGDYSSILAGTFKRVVDTLSIGGPAGASPSKSSFGAGPINREMYKSSKGIPTFAEGGKLGAGEIGIAGEAGPELISGPSSVLNNASYEKLMIVLDAMKEKKGVRFADNGFQRGVGIDSNIVGTTESYAEIVNKRTSGFEGLSDTDLQREIQSRPEYADMQKAKAAMDDDMGMGKNQVDTSAKIDQTNSLLSELVTAMKQNVTQTSRVAMNTN